MTDPVELAHEHTADHRDEILRSDRCGCGHCLAVFEPGEIAEWTDDERTALCPRCGIDIVLGSASGWPLTAEFLDRLRRRWFGP